MKRRRLSVSALVRRFPVALALTLAACGADDRGVAAGAPDVALPPSADAARAPGPDATTPARPDAGTPPAPDAGKPPERDAAIAPTPDAAVEPTPDAATVSAPDAVVPPRFDAATPQESDAVTPSADAAIAPAPDATSPSADAATPPMADAQPAIADVAPPPAPDAGPPPTPDAAPPPPEPDAFIPEPDPPGPPPFSPPAGPIATGPDAPAIFEVRSQVLNTAPPRFGANIAYDYTANFTRDPGFEPLTLRIRGRVSRVGVDPERGTPTLVHDDGAGTSYYDTLSTGFFDGAAVRVYRDGPDGVTLVRTDRVARYFADTSTNLESRAVLNPRYTDTGHNLRNGRDYYYAVAAVDVDGNESARTPEVRAQPQAGLGAPAGVNALRDTDLGRRPGEAPPTPMNLRATARDGGVELVWDPVAAPDLAGYRVYRARVAAAARRAEVVLEGADPDAAPVQAGDWYYLDHAADDPPREAVSDRLPWIQQWDTWPTSGPVVATRVRDVPPTPDAGATSMRLVTEAAERVQIGQYRYGSTISTYPQLLPGVRYHMGAWLKQSGVPGGRVRLGMDAEYRAVGTTFEGVGAEWAYHGFEFDGPPLPRPNQPIIRQFVEFTGPGTVWVDGLVVHEAARAPFDFDPAALEALSAFRPGTLRIWSGFAMQLGTSLEDWIQPEAVRRNVWSVNNGIHTGPEFKLPLALEVCELVGAAPWLIVGPHMDEAEWAGLIEFLAGEPGTPWADRRAALGRDVPWTDTFDDIYLEFGNETWNPIFSPWAFGTTGGAEAGRFAEHFFRAAQASPAFAAVAHKIHFVVGGWDIQPGEDGYGVVNRRAAPSARFVANAHYLGGWEAGFVIGGDQVTDAGFETMLHFVPEDVLPRQEAHARTHAAMRAAGVEYTLAAYEGGPGYALPNPGTPYDAVTEVYGKSQAAAVATLDSYLLQQRLGYGPTNYFLFQPGYNWTSHTTPAQGYRPHAMWQALQMRNTLASGDVLAVDAVGGPTFDGAGGEAGPLVETYAYHDAARRRTTVFTLSRRLAGVTPVEVYLPSAAGTTVTAHTLVGDPRETNLDLLRLSVAQGEPRPFEPVLRFDLPAGGIVAHVVEGVTLPAGPAPGAPVAVRIDQAPTQVDPAPLPIVAFVATFDRPVSGLTAEDVVVEGDAAPAAQLEVTPLVEAHGRRWRIDVVDLARFGTVRVSLPAGAAQALDDRAPSAASTALDDTVTWAALVPQDRLLLEEDFDTVGPYPPYLHGAEGGIGFAGAWRTQNFDPAALDGHGRGYERGELLPLDPGPAVRHSPAYALGGRVYTATGRGLDLADAFADFVIWRSQPARIGQSGTTLWGSALLRKDAQPGEPLWVGFSQGNFAEVRADGRLLVGTFGAASLGADGLYRWGVQVRNAADDGFETALTARPVVLGETVLAVWRVDFGLQDTVQLYLDPEPGLEAPAIADAVIVAPAERNVAFRTLGFYGGSGVLQGSVDAVRVGDTFHAVVPAR